MGGRVTLDMYVGMHDPLPEDTDDEAGPPVDADKVQPLHLPAVIRPSLGGERKVMEEPSGSGAVDPLQAESDALTARILALIDERTGVTERMKERARRGAGVTKKSPPFDPVFDAPPQPTPSDAPGRSFASVVAAGTSRPASDDRLVAGDEGRGNDVPKAEASRKRRERRQRSKRRGKIAELPPNPCSSGEGEGEGEGEEGKQ